jgi:hypothetical protein
LYVPFGAIRPSRSFFFFRDDGFFGSFTLAAFSSTLESTTWAVGDVWSVMMMMLEVQVLCRLTTRIPMGLLMDDSGETFLQIGQCFVCATRLYRLSYLPTLSEHESYLHGLLENKCSPDAQFYVYLYRWPTMTVSFRSELEPLSSYNHKGQQRQKHMISHSSRLTLTSWFAAYLPFESASQDTVPAVKLHLEDWNFTSK